MTCPRCGGQVAPVALRRALVCLDCAFTVSEVERQALRVEDEGVTTLERALAAKWQRLQTDHTAAAPVMPIGGRVGQ